MKAIQLSKGKETIVDDAVYEALMQHGWKWQYSSDGYAVASIKYHSCTGRTTTAVYLHRWIWDSWANRSLGGLQIDHINRDRLDNRLENLRAATHGQNRCNSENSKNNISKYRGIWFDKRCRKYRAHLVVNGKRNYLGYYTDPLDAAKAYDEAAQQYHGEFASINFNTSTQWLKEFQSWTHNIF
jgi:hypothetical protein